MIGYTTVGTNDLARSTAFYDALFEPLQARRSEPNERVRLWRVKGGSSMFGVAVPFDGEPASVGNGTMISLNVGTQEMVDKLHARALELGGTDEGAPGLRGGGPFYGGYFRDPDGNKLVAYCVVK